jgi:hypothetical protein
MDLAWNICPYCGTPAPGMRKENETMDEVMRELPTDEGARTGSLPNRP